MNGYPNFSKGPKIPWGQGPEGNSTVCWITVGGELSPQIPQQRERDPTSKLCSLIGTWPHQRLHLKNSLSCPSPPHSNKGEGKDLASISQPVLAPVIPVSAYAQQMGKERANRRIPS